MKRYDNKLVNFSRHPQYRDQIVPIPDSYERLLEHLSKLGLRDAVLFSLYDREIGGELVAEHDKWKRLNEVSKAPFIWCAILL